MLTVLLLAGACEGGTAGTASTPTSGPTSMAPAEQESPSETPAAGPLARCYAVVTDAPGKTGVLLFGGWDKPVEPDSSWQTLWSFRPGTGWSELAADPMPEGGDVFGYDAQSDRAVFMEVSGATWAFDPSTGAWESRQPEGAPALHGSRLVYDSESDRLITFGGDDFSNLFDDTWAYDYESNTWTKMSPPRSPSARSFYAMAYDEGSDRVILFGGFDALDELLGDTWAYDYDSDTWTRVSRRGGPEPRGYSAMAYDRRTDRTILFGGITGSFEEPLNDTWTLHLETSTWERLQVPGPSARGWHVMAADAESDSIVLFGGGASRADCTDETWIFDPAADTWSQVA